MCVYGTPAAGIRDLVQASVSRIYLMITKVNGTD